MGRESAISQLEPQDKSWLDRQLMDKGFCGYEEIANLLAERGYAVSKSSVHRYGEKLERKLAAVQASTQAAILISEAAPDDGDQRSAAVLSLMQTELFNALVAFQDASELDSEGKPIDPSKRLALLASCGKGIADIAKASVNLKKHQAEVKAKAEIAAKEVDKIVKKGGLSAETAADIRKQILGIAG
jgi:hypothetical protein